MRRSIVLAISFVITSIFAGGARAQSPSTDPPKKPEEGIVALQNDTTSIRLRPVLQADGRFFLQGGTNTLLARRIRPAIEATFFDRLDVRITPELAQSTPS